MSAIIGEKVREFLEQEVRTAKLAYTGSDGRPLVAPVWFALEDEVIVFNTGKTSAKGSAITRDPRLALCVDQERGFTFVQIQGIASTSEESTEVLRVATGIAGRYMGADKAEKVGTQIAGPGQLAVYLRPTRVVGSGDLTG